MVPSIVPRAVQPPPSWLFSRILSSPEALDVGHRHRARALGPSALRVDCGIRGQGVRPMVTNITTASSGEAHACGAVCSVYPWLGQSGFPCAAFCPVAPDMQC